MTQNFIGQITDTTAESGNDLAARLNAFDTAHKTNQAGATRPTGIAAGGLWTRADGGGAYSLMLYDGATDIKVGQVLIDEDDMASDSASRPPSQQSVKAFVEGKRFTSSAQTITSGGLLTIAHGLGVTPGMVRFRLKCTTAEQGYSIGDEIIVSENSTAGASFQRFTGIRMDATNVYIRFSNNAAVFSTANATTGAATVLTNANWELYVEAMV